MQPCCLSGFGSSSESSDEGEIIDDIGDVENVEGWCRQTGRGRECHIPEPKAFLMQLCVAFVSEDKNPVQLLPLRHTASLIHRAWWVVLRRFSSHPTICLLMPPPWMLKLWKPGDFFYFFIFFLGWEKKKFLQRHQLSASQTHSDCRDGALGSEEKDQSRCLCGVLVSPAAVRLHL